MVQEANQQTEKERIRACLIRRYMPLLGGVCIVGSLFGCSQRGLQEVEEELVYPPILAGEHLEMGREIWIEHCTLCHEDGGEDDAPLLGDIEEWTARSANGLDALVKTAIEGKGYMPARGGKKGLKDEHVKKAVEYMVEASR